MNFKNLLADDPKVYTGRIQMIEYPVEPTEDKFLAGVGQSYRTF